MVLTYLLWYIPRLTAEPVHTLQSHVDFRVCVCVCVILKGSGTDTIDVLSCVRREWVCECVCVCVCLDKTANPQATRTQYPVSQILISCLSVARREKKKDA